MNEPIAVRTVRRPRGGGSAAISEVSEVQQAGKESECYRLTFTVKITLSAALHNILCVIV